MKVMIKPDTTQTTMAAPRPRGMRQAPCALAIALVALAAGCDAATGTTDGGSGGGAVEPTFTSLYGDYLGNCKQCHSPTGTGRTSDIEKTLDFTSRSTAFSTVKGMASGLVGNHAGCNGTPFLTTTPGTSLLVAVVDQPTRQAIDIPQHADCDSSAISDETVKVGSQPSSEFIAALKTWITNGAQNN